MRPDDLEQLFEQAFSKNEPKDDVQRERMEAMRKRILGIKDKMLGEMDTAREALSRLDPTPASETLSAEVKALNADWSAVEKEIRAMVASSFDEQSELIHRIASKSRKS